MTKLDGDARGGAALSIKAVTGKPIKFIGVSEKLDGLEEFHPNRYASRILDLGDVETIIEKAQAAFDEESMENMKKTMKSGTFTFDDFLSQLHMIKKMGNMGSLLSLIPGIGKYKKELDKVTWTAKNSNESKHHHIHDGPGTVECQSENAHQGQPQAPYRQGQRHARPGCQPPHQAVRRNAEDDEAGQESTEE